MDPLRLQQYRQALGISQWVPRSKLPGAPGSRLCTLPPGVRVVNPQQQRRDAQHPAMPSNHNAQVSEQGADKSKHQSIRARLKLELGSEPAGKQPSRLTDDAIAIGRTVAYAPAPSFSLVFWQITAGELLVAELPPGAKELMIPVRNYLQDLLFALGYQSQNGQPGNPFHWPMVNSVDIDQSDQAASQALVESLQTYHNDGPIKRIIALGQVPARLLAVAEDNFDTLRGKPLQVRELPSELLVTHGVGAVFAEPALKAQVWMDLAPQLIETRPAGNA